MKCSSYGDRSAHHKRTRSNMSTSGEREVNMTLSSQLLSHRPRKALLSRPSPDSGRSRRDTNTYRDSKKEGMAQRMSSHFQVTGRNTGVFSKLSGSSARYTGDQSRPTFPDPLSRVDPVLAAAAAAAMLNAGFMPSSSASTDFTGLTSGTGSPSTASAVAAVAAAAMNAAAMAAALGVGGSGTSSGGKNLYHGGKSFKSISQSSRVRPSLIPSAKNAPDLSMKTSRGSRTTPTHHRFENNHDNSLLVRFPHHLDHRDPEDDPTASRTLFVGNLMPEITEGDLRSLFEKYGFIEDIDIKRRDPESGVNAYAFIRFVNLDMAHRAKVDMSGQLIGQFTCKIGYGKVVPTRCLWIGGLGPWITYPAFATLLNEFGPTEKIIWPSGKNYANVLFPSVELAVVAADALRGYPLGGPNRRIRVDFTDESHMIRDPLKRRRFQTTDSSSSMPFDRTASYSSRGDRDSTNTALYLGKSVYHRSNKRGRTSTSSDSTNHTRRNEPPRKTYRSSRDALLYRRRSDDSVSSQRKASNTSKLPRSPRLTTDPKSSLARSDITVNPQSAVTVDQLANCLSVVWTGAFFLKSSSFSCRMHILRGDQSLVDQFMVQRSVAKCGTHGSASRKHSLSKDNRTSDDSGTCLRITQRMKLDPLKLEDVSQRISGAGNTGFCVLLAVPSPASLSTDSSTDSGKQSQRPLRNLVSYLRTKDSAGVVILSPGQCPSTSSHSVDVSSTTGVLHAFPPCDFAYSLLKERATCLQPEYNKDDHLVILLIRSSGAL